MGRIMREELREEGMVYLVSHLSVCKPSNSSNSSKLYSLLLPAGQFPKLCRTFTQTQHTGVHRQLRYCTAMGHRVSVPAKRTRTMANNNKMPTHRPHHLMIPLHPPSFRYMLSTWIAQLGSLIRLSNSVPRQLHLGSKTVISQHQH